MHVIHSCIRVHHSCRNNPNGTDACRVKQKSATGRCAARRYSKTAHAWARLFPQPDFKSRRRCVAHSRALCALIHNYVVTLSQVLHIGQDSGWLTSLSPSAQGGLASVTSNERWWVVCVGWESQHLPAVFDALANLVDVHRELDDVIVLGQHPPGWQAHEGVGQHPPLLVGELHHDAYHLRGNLVILYNIAALFLEVD